MSDKAYTRREILWETVKYAFWMFYFNPLAPMLVLAIWMLTLLALVWQGYWLLAAVVVHVLIWYGSYRMVLSDLPGQPEESQPIGFW